jgi:hypothetical protein
MPSVAVIIGKTDRSEPEFRVFIFATGMDVRRFVVFVRPE